MSWYVSYILTHEILSPILLISSYLHHMVLCGLFTVAILLSDGWLWWMNVVTCLAVSSCAVYSGLLLFIRNIIKRVAVLVSVTLCNEHHMKSHECNLNSTQVQTQTCMCTHIHLHMLTHTLNDTPHISMCYTHTHTHTQTHTHTNTHTCTCICRCIRYTHKYA